MMKLYSEEFERDGHWVDGVYYQKEVSVTITNPVPDSVVWHRATQWRHADELYRNNRAAWNKMKAKAQIPIDVILRVED